MAVDVAQFEVFRPALIGHCYRMLGSPFDADDAVQETMIRAWRAYDGFDGRSSVKSWLYRIATNVCLDELKSRGRRIRPMEDGPPGSGAPSSDELTQFANAYWIEPIPDTDVCSPDAGPDEKASLRQSIRLARIHHRWHWRAAFGLHGFLYHPPHRGPRSGPALCLSRCSRCY